MTTLKSPALHPFYSKLRKFKIPLWQVSLFLGGSPSETTLSRMLRNIQPLPAEVAEKIEKLIDSVMEAKNA